MKTNQLIWGCFMVLISLSIQAQNYGGEIISNQKFGEGLMVVRAKIVPISGTVSNIFFFNRDDEPWNGNVWYEYDWEIRGKYPSNGWAQIRVRSENGAKLKDEPKNISTSVNLGKKLYNYILIRKDKTYVYDIREDFDINTYNYKNASSHGKNSKSLIVGGPRVYKTGDRVDHIPQNEKLDFSLGITAFDNSWAGSLPSGSYSGDFYVDYARFYTYKNNNLNTKPNWQDEFNNSSLDYGKWQVANWTYSKTQFRQENIRFNNGNVIFKIRNQSNNNNNNNNNSSSNLALSGKASQSSTDYDGNAARAIDNNTNGKWRGSSVTHTKNQNNAWWQVKLSQNSNINEIVIYNRTDNCCTSRLDDFTVLVLNENGSVAWSKYYSNTPSPSLKINLNTTGKVVKISQNGTLSLAEVQVFGNPVNNKISSVNNTNDLNIYPNPTNGHLFINLTDYAEKKVNLILSDVSGKELITKNLASKHPLVAQLDLSNLNNGLYILYIKVENEAVIKKKISLTKRN